MSISEAISPTPQSRRLSVRNAIKSYSAGAAPLAAGALCAVLLRSTDSPRSVASASAICPRLGRRSAS
ncbi:unnamed protein product, partial [Iphiclides podalirius]